MIHLAFVRARPCSVANRLVRITATCHGSSKAGTWTYLCHTLHWLAPTLTILQPAASLSNALDDDLRSEYTIHSMVRYRSFVRRGSGSRARHTKSMPQVCFCAASWHSNSTLAAPQDRMNINQKNSCIGSMVNHCTSTISFPWLTNLAV